jgi:hypothetical protein
MSTSVQQQLLLDLLAGTEPTLATITGLTSCYVEEDLHLDYKAAAIIERDVAGKKVGSPNDFGGKVRKHVAGFANGDGGVLILGVDEYEKVKDPSTGRDNSNRNRPRTLTPLPWTPEEAKTRARDALAQLRHTLHPPPRIYAIAFGDAGCVLVIAVPRAEGTVFCLENEQRIYYIRLHDATVFAPAYLVDDMILGRRRRPAFTVSLDATIRREISAHALDLKITMHNAGLVWMDRPRLGVVGYSSMQRVGQDVSSAVAPYVQVYTPSPAMKPRMVPFRCQEVAESIAPFDSVSVSAAGNSFSVRFPSGGELFWAAALYVVCHNQPPAWYQLVIWADDIQTRKIALPVGDRRAVVAQHTRAWVGSAWSPHIGWCTFDGDSFESHSWR